MCYISFHLLFNLNILIHIGYNDSTYIYNVFLAYCIMIMFHLTLITLNKESFFGIGLLCHPRNSFQLRNIFPSLMSNNCWNCRDQTRGPCALTLCWQNCCISIISITMVETLPRMPHVKWEVNWPKNFRGDNVWKLGLKKLRQNCKEC